MQAALPQAYKDLFFGNGRTSKGKDSQRGSKPNAQSR